MTHFSKRNLGKSVGKSTLTANEDCRETSEFRRLPAFCGAFSLSAFQFSAFQLYQSPLFPSNPLFPALRPSLTAVSAASRQKQIPSNKARLPHLRRRDGGDGGIVKQMFYRFSNALI